MPRMGIKAKDPKALELLEKVIEETVIIQRQKSLIIGRWDFVVFGIGDNNKVVVRKGYAEQSTIKRAPIYIASIGDPSLIDREGIPIEELIEDDLPEEYQGLEIFQIDPLRPLVIEKKLQVEGGEQAFDKISREYESENIAVIHAPKECDWPVAVLKYLTQCDRDFPDMALQAFISKSRSSGKGSLGAPSNLLN
jgi:hypothetical protein